MIVSIPNKHLTENQTYWFNTCMNHITSEADQLGEVIPRIKVFLARLGDINTTDDTGETLLSKAHRFKLDHVVKFLRSQEHQGSLHTEISRALASATAILVGVTVLASIRPLPSGFILR